MLGSSEEQWLLLKLSSISSAYAVCFIFQAKSWKRIIFLFCRVLVSVYVLSKWSASWLSALRIPRRIEQWISLLLSVSSVIIVLYRWNPLPQQQCFARGAQLQWASLHCVPLANRSLGSVYRGHIGVIFQYDDNVERGGLMFCGHANTKSHLCASQRGPSGAQEVRPLEYLQ